MRRLEVMPLVSRDCASALSGHSFAWEELELSQPPQNWSKLVGWAASHCKHTHQLTLEDLKSGSEEALQKLLTCFLALRTIKLTGRISGSPSLWSHLLVHRLQHLHIELSSINQADIDGMSLMQGLQHLSLQVSPRLLLPSCLSYYHYLLSCCIMSFYFMVKQCMQSKPGVCMIIYTLSKCLMLHA